MILVLTNADTEILALRSVLEGLPDGFPPVRAANPNAQVVPEVAGAQVVLVRLLGGRRAWQEPFDQLRRRCLDEGIPLLAFGGEAAPDAELTALSTVPSATLAQAFEYLVHGGLANTEHLLRFVADTVLYHGFGFEPPAEVLATGVYRATPPGPAPLIAVVFYRAHLIAGNTSFVDDLCRAIEAKGARALALWCYSLRPGEDGRIPALDLLAEHRPDAVITTVLASGSAGSDGGDWDAASLAGLGVPVVQATAATSPRADWEANPGGLFPLDVAMSVAIPEFDGRIISVPFSFKEVVDDGDTLGTPVSAYRTVPDRVGRVAGIAVRLAGLGRVPVAERRVAIVLSAYPTKRSRIGNAVALDTPASVIALLHRLRAAGYRVDRIPDDGDALMAELVDTFSYERETLTAAQLGRAVGRWPGAAYRQWFATLPAGLQEQLGEKWGPAPGSVYLDHSSGELVFAGLDLGHVVIAVQPPRGFGEDPIAVYHSPDLPPTHHYLAFYRWLDEGWGADAIVHAGKHGTLEWLPGKGVGLSSSCFPDASLGDIPLIYPFVVNDPGEGTQAKRRAHAVIIDHLLPPMTRAETYDDLARLEGLLDAYAQVAALDPSKLAAIRRQVWELLVSASLHQDLGVDQAPDGEAFDELILHVDGYLCELKDAQIRGGLHVLGQPPVGEAELDLVLALTRLPQASSVSGPVPSLRATVAGRLGVDLDAGSFSSREPHIQCGSAITKEAVPGVRGGVDAVEAACRELLARCQGAGWTYDGADPTLRWVCSTLVPALQRTPDELVNILGGLDGRYIPAGPSGAPTRGMAHVLPTGRNFYSVDPKALPSPLAWDVGWGLASALVERHLAEEGRYPASVGLVVWGTAAMRTGGDDMAMALALLGVRPVWGAENGRVTGVALIPSEELGRPRVDVVLRISGFFRDAFPHLIALFDDAVRLAGFGADGDPRIFGAKPGAYGSGILGLLESRDWRSDDDLAAVYQAWGGYSYGRAGMGVPAGAAMARRFAAIEVAVKNQDNREHDIFDSDDYLQDHGGMIATIRALTGRQPKAFFGDSADPARPRVRSLAEEAARVVRSRVVNPKWIAAMARHGYKGAFELAATVDYLYGYDATAHVVEDWMYEQVTSAYVADPSVRKFFEVSNPWALRSIAERLLEAVDRGLWASPSPESLSTLRAALLEAEGWEESR
ncbi:MAG: cobaltochelatase subunit CobN [Actinomycetota bacterium]|nr:cobaltochelatase subunit CobN [Actinomycetota bacterium]